MDLKHFLVIGCLGKKSSEKNILQKRVIMKLWKTVEGLWYDVPLILSKYIFFQCNGSQMVYVAGMCWQTNCKRIVDGKKINKNSGNGQNLHKCLTVGETPIRCSDYTLTGKLCCKLCSHVYYTLDFDKRS